MVEELKFYKSVEVFNVYVSPFTITSNKFTFNYSAVILGYNPRLDEDITFSIEFGMGYWIRNSLICLFVIPIYLLII